MAGWSERELAAVGDADELVISARRANGDLRAGVPIWVVRVGDEIFVRSYKGRGSGWFRHAVETHTGHIGAGGVERDVAFEEAPDAEGAEIDDTYRTKYARYGDSYTLPMVTPVARDATLRLVPVPEG
jgi:hypothetical protein